MHGFYFSIQFICCHVISRSMFFKMLCICGKSTVLFVNKTSNTEHFVVLYRLHVLNTSSWTSYSKFHFVKKNSTRMDQKLKHKIVSRNSLVLFQFRFELRRVRLSFGYNRDTIRLFAQKYICRRNFVLLKNHNKGERNLFFRCGRRRKSD